MFKYSDSDRSNFSLHDCRAEQIYFKNNILSFVFSKGFFILPNCIYNKTDNVVRSDTAQVDFKIINEEITIYIFKKSFCGKIIRKECKLNDFMNLMNNSKYQLEYVDEYEGYQSRLFKCYLWFDKKPYHYECEINLLVENETYLWNDL